MSLKETITNDMVAAMKAKDANRLSVLRMAKAALMNEANKKSADYELTDDESAKVLQILANQRKDSIEQYEKGGRTELAEKEKSELAVLQDYLPQAASKEETELAVTEAVTETGASSMKEMGAVMKAAQAKLSGKLVDGRLLSETVKAKLQNS